MSQLPYRHLPKRGLGSTGIDVSILGLGTVKFGRNQGVKYPAEFQIPSMNELANLLARARDLGINLVDTAPAYGSSEEKLGELLKGQRDQWIVCSKAGEDFENGESRFAFSAEAIRHSIERSLKRLNTEVIDIALIHSDGNDEAIINDFGALDTLRDLKQRGLIRAFGMSTKTVAGGLLAAQHSDCVMATYNLAHQDEKPVLDYCHANKKGVLLKKVLASGHLNSFTTEGDPLQASMRFALSHPVVTSAIVGTINVGHLEANVAAACAAVNG